MMVAAFTLTIKKKINTSKASYFCINPYLPLCILLECRVGNLYAIFNAIILLGS